MYLRIVKIFLASLSLLMIFIVGKFLFLKKSDSLSKSRIPTKSVIEDMASRTSEPFLENYKIALKNLHEESLKKKEDTKLEALNMMRFTFTSMHDLKSHMNKDELRKKLLDELLLKKESVPLAVRTLTDSDFARDTFAKEQAIARVYSIQLLRYLADQGNIEPLQEAARDLSKKLAEKENVRPGEWRDLEDLIESLILVKDPNHVVENIHDFLVDLSYSEKSEESFFKALYFGLRNTLSKEDLENFLEKALKAL